MSIQKQTALTPELLLWEIGAILARHGITFSTDNPSAAVHHATRLLQALGILVTVEPAALPPAPTPFAPSVQPLASPGRPGFADEIADALALVQTSHLPVVPPLPRGADVGRPPRPHPLDRVTPVFQRGRHRPGDERSLRLVDEEADHVGA